MEKFDLEKYKDENGAYDLTEVPVEELENAFKVLSSENMLIVDSSVMNSMVDIFLEEYTHDFRNVINEDLLSNFRKLRKKNR